VMNRIEGTWSIGWRGLSVQIVDVPIRNMPISGHLPSS
jgi:hypothetical protein